MLITSGSKGLLKPRKSAVVRKFCHPWFLSCLTKVHKTLYIYYYKNLTPFLLLNLLLLVPLLSYGVLPGETKI